MPKRLQRKRTKGYRLPPNSVYVGRPTKWGNPFTAVDWRGQALNARAVARYRRWLNERTPLAGIMPPSLDEIKRELHGKSLACWCKLCPKHRDEGKPLTEYCPDCKPCHIDVIAELLYGAPHNSEASRG